MNSSESTSSKQVRTLYILFCLLLGSCYVYSSKINMLHSEKVIISGVKVVISSDYIKC